jgi:hypothetical protein
MLIKDGGYCIPGLCIVTETLHQRLQISQALPDDHQLGIDLGSCMVGAVAVANLEVSRTCEGQNVLLSVVPNKIQKIHPGRQTWQVEAHSVR